MNAHHTIREDKNRDRKRKKFAQQRIRHGHFRFDILLRFFFFFEWGEGVAPGLMPENEEIYTPRSAVKKKINPLSINVEEERAQRDARKMEERKERTPVL
jgi:hypothetical protein